MIREASLTDLPALRDIERAAGASFRDLGMSAIADDEPLSIDELAVFQRAGRAWVYVDPLSGPPASGLTSTEAPARYEPGVSARRREDAGSRPANAERMRGHVIAYLLVAVIDGYAHIEQVSVHPGHSRQGIGQRLVDHAGAWARSQGLAGLTLTTFTDVPWNAPYYERLGFRVVTDPSPGLRAVRQHEAELGLDAWPRVVMRRDG